MILLSRNFLVAIGRLEGAQEAPDFPLAKLVRQPLLGWVVQKNYFVTKWTLYMVLVSIIFFVGTGYLKGPQEAPDVPLAVAPPGSGLARWGSPESGQNPHHIHFYTKCDMYYSVLC